MLVETEIAKWLETHNVTKCPTAFVLPTKNSPSKRSSKDLFLLRRHNRIQKEKEKERKALERKIIQSFFCFLLLIPLLN